MFKKILNNINKKISTINQKVNTIKEENNHYKELLETTTTFQNLFSIPELNNKPSEHKITIITNESPDINKEKATLISKLIPINETFLTTIYSKEIKTNQEYREYIDKYNLENYLNGNIVRTNPADISEKMNNEIIDLAKKTINLLNNTGLSTIDFLYDQKRKKLYIDEINSIPTCFSHHLWEEANISYKELFTIMINDTIKNFNKDNEMITTMDMSVLKNLKNSDIREFK